MADRNMYSMRGAMFDAAIRQQLDEAARRGIAADDELALVAHVSVCRRCGAKRWVERRI